MKPAKHKVNDAYKDLVKRNLFKDQMLKKKQAQQESEGTEPYERYIRNPTKQKASKKESVLKKKQAHKEKKAQKQLAEKQMSIDTEIQQPINDIIGGLKNKKLYDGLSNEVIIGMAEACENNGAFVDARDLYFFAGERGSLEAIFKAGELAESGNLGVKDFVSASDCYLLAAKSGHVPAMEIVAHNYFLGVGVEKDEMRSAAYICAAHALEPNVVWESFYKLKKLINKDTFDLGKTLSYSIFATDDQAIRIERKVEALRRVKESESVRAAEKQLRAVEVAKKSNANKYDAANSNDESYPLGFVLFMVVVMVFLFYHVGSK
jgi:TPR repeat protein